MDARIAATYAARSNATNRISLYDSYVRAIRWASDRVGKSGIVGFVTNASFIDGAANGLRKCLAEEFSSLYVFHLRGNARTSGERRKKEAGNVFGSGSRAPVALSLLVKNPSAPETGRIYFRDIGDYLTQEQKLETVSRLGNVAGVAGVNGWTRITPDAHGDWLRQRDSSFCRFIVVGNKKEGEPALFAQYSNGVKTQRDAWAYSPSRKSLGENMGRMIATYNKEVKRFRAAHAGLDTKAREAALDGFIDTDPKKIAWTRALKADLARGTTLTLDETKMVPSLYRPFSKEWLYFDRKLNELVLQNPRFFPSADAENRVIGVSAGESRSGYSVLMADVVPSLHSVDMVGTQFFPLYVYDIEAGEFVTAASNAHASTPRRLDGITDAGLKHFRHAYPGDKITKEDVFYYVYGILYSPDYRERYSDNLGKELPRIPRVKSAADFRTFSRAGRALGELHVGYDRVAEYSGVTIEGPARPTAAQYRVEKMTFPRGSDGGKDKSIIHFNAFLTIRGIPPEVYDFVVNGKSAVEWVMDRQCITTEKDSGIVKDANAWATETVKDARYPLSLLLRVMTVSLETTKIVRSLPTLDVEDTLGEDA